MLRSIHSRRRPRYGSHVCAFIAAFLLLLSVVLLHSRLAADSRGSNHPLPSDDLVSDSDRLLDDADPEYRSTGRFSEDRIDELDDVVQEDSDASRVLDEDDILRGVDAEEEDSEQSRVSRYYFDHVSGVIRRAFDKRSIDQWEDYVSFEANLRLVEDNSKAAFASDDVPLDENARRKVTEVRGMGDALLLPDGSRDSPLRAGWGRWFDAKSDFLRRDKMFKSNLELLNPLNNPFLQDPDGVGITGLTRGDKLVQKGLLNEFKKVPFLGKKPLGIAGLSGESKLRSKTQLLEDTVGEGFNGKDKETETSGESRIEARKMERITLDHNAVSKSQEVQQINGKGNSDALSGSKNAEDYAQFKSEFSSQLFADGKRWGYFPGLHPRLSFSNFMDAFLRKGKCSMRVFMVWNSPPWMFSVRHQRGLESLLFHHRDACVVIFSESVELNFFSSFVKDGFKIAVVMPNLDELLKDTPTHVFASVWFEWKKTKFYPTHYSELIRLVALYKYGGIYLDSDILVLKPLSSLSNTVSLEDDLPGYHLNGAVMAFKKHSPFLMECLTEFYVSYDDTRLRWNGADLLARVARNFFSKGGSHSKEQADLKLQPSSIFFPISRNNITRYFMAPATQAERAQEDDLFRDMLNKSFTFHFWNGLTYALVPDPESLVARLFSLYCIVCSDVL